MQSVAGSSGEGNGVEPIRGAFQVDEGKVRAHVEEVVRQSVEETLNLLLDQEADQLCNARRYERSAERADTRAGSYPRKLQTKAGEVTLKVPRLRSLPFETSIIERYRRREASVEEALVEMYLAGVSMRRVEDITEALWGTRASASTVSGLSQKVYGQIEAWRNRPIEGEHAYVFLDGIWLKRSWGGEVKNVAVLVALGVDREGFREVLGVAEGTKEDRESWRTFLRHLKDRGLRGIRLFISDKCLAPGSWWRALRSPAAAWQRCVVHTSGGYRNVFTAGADDEGEGGGGEPIDKCAQLDGHYLEHTGSTVTVKAIAGGSEPGEGTWSGTSACYSSTSFGTATRGMIGLSPGEGELSVDDVTIKTDRDNNGSFETTELVETFTVDSGGYAEEAPTHDAAGNMTYDGIYAYGYDAWNRMVKVQKAWRTGNVPGGALNTGSVISESRYDGMGRRVVKAVQNSGDLDCTFHYYYNPGGHSLIETRNGSNATLKQNVWGLTYVDELVQVSINDDPADSSERVCETGYYALQNANFNVVALVDASGGGAMVERYEYAPYGQRTVYSRAAEGSDDPKASAPRPVSRRVSLYNPTFGTWSIQPYGINEMGHQGLYNDEETGGGSGGGLIYNRARMLHTGVGRFAQRDPLGYVDGSSLYEYLRSNWTRLLDPTGQSTALPPVEWRPPAGISKPRGLIARVVKPLTAARLWVAFSNGVGSTWDKHTLTRRDTSGPSSCPSGFKHVLVSRSQTQEYISTTVWGGVANSATGWIRNDIYDIYGCFECPCSVKKTYDTDWQEQTLGITRETWYLKVKVFHEHIVRTRVENWTCAK